MALFHDISVIVIVRNGERYLKEALTSIQAQTHPVYETIVVDGQSTDNTLAIAAQFLVRVITQTNRGIAGARNLGIAAARGQYIAFLDHDDRWHPDKLARQMALHEQRPEIAYSLTGMMFFYDDDYVPSSGEPPRIAGTPSVLVARRALFEQLGGFDARYQIACDAEWFTRARDAQIPTATIPEILAYKRLHDNNASRLGSLNRQEMFAIARESIARQKYAQHD